MWRSKIFENCPVVLLSGSEILGVSIWRPKIFENFTAALMSGSEILLSAHGAITYRKNAAVVEAWGHMGALENFGRVHVAGSNF